MSNQVIKMTSRCFRMNISLNTSCRPSISSIMSTSQYNPYHTSIPRLKLIVENVPPLGESITEGSIGKWMKQPGDKVAVDDVITVVETDKVTVDIKSTYSGVLTQQFCTDKVTVGAPLYEIDTDMESAATASAATAATPTTPSSAASPASSSSPEADHAHGHHPLIKFVGKRSKLASTKSSSSSTHTSSSPASSQAVAAKAIPAFSASKELKPSGRAVDFATMKDGAFYGRPKLTAKEIEAIESGGAV